MAYVPNSEEYSYTYATTGTKDQIPVDPTKLVTVVVNAGASDDVDIEAKFTSAGSFRKIVTGISELYVASISGSPIAVQLVINTNTSGAVAFEVKQSVRG